MTGCRSRLAGLFQLLEKVASPHDVASAQTSPSSSTGCTSLPPVKTQSCRFTADDVQQLRYLTSKILQHINAQGYCPSVCLSHASWRILFEVDLCVPPVLLLLRVVDVVFWSGSRHPDIHWTTTVDHTSVPVALGSPYLSRIARSNVNWRSACFNTGSGLPVPVVRRQCI